MINKIIIISQPSKYMKREAVLGHYDIKNDSFFIEKGLGYFIAKWLIKNKPEFEIQMKRIDATINEKIEKTVCGIKSTVYPNQGSNKFMVSLYLIRDIKKEITNNNTIIWFDGLHNYSFQILSLLFKNTFQVAHTLGGENFRFKFQKTNNFKYKITEIIEKYFFIRNINIAILGTMAEYKYFKENEKKGNIVDLGYVVGINQTRWHIIGQNDARIKLNLPLDAKIVLQSGRAMLNKGTDVAIRIYEKQLEQKGIDLYLTAVSEHDELFGIVKESGCKNVGFVDYDQFPLWMAAADVYLYVPFDEITLQFAGVGYAPLEALAVGTPIVCTTAKFMPFYGINLDDYMDIIKVPTNESEIADMIFKLFEKKPSPEKCHDFIEQYFSNEKIMQNIIDKLNRCL